MDEFVKSDLFRYNGVVDFKTFLKCFYYEPGFRFTYFMRLSAKYRKFTLPGFVYRFFYVRYTYKYGFQIPKETCIGKGLIIKHFGCIVVHPKAVLGNNCYLSHGITIGQTNRGKMEGVPTLGNKVYIGTGSVVVGKITIGDNVLIAPNMYINFDVPSNCIVKGYPAVIVPRSDATEGYITNVY